MTATLLLMNNQSTDTTETILHWYSLVNNNFTAKSNAQSTKN
jgi:hypothetical protein